MTDETDSRDHKREKVLASNMFNIHMACNKLLDLSEKIEDIGLDKLSADINIIELEIMKNVREIQDRYEYVYKVKESKHFTVVDEK